MPNQMISYTIRNCAKKNLIPSTERLLHHLNECFSSGVTPYSYMVSWVLMEANMQNRAGSSRTEPQINKKNKTKTNFMLYYSSAYFQWDVKYWVLFYIDFYISSDWRWKVCVSLKLWENKDEIIFFHLVLYIAKR